MVQRHLQPCQVYFSKDHNMLQNTVFSTFHCAYSELSRQFDVDKITWHEREGHVTVTRRFSRIDFEVSNCTWTFDFQIFVQNSKFSFYFTIVKFTSDFEIHFEIRVYNNENRKQKSHYIQISQLILVTNTDVACKTPCNSDACNNDACNSDCLQQLLELQCLQLLATDWKWLQLLAPDTGDMMHVRKQWWFESIALIMSQSNLFVLEHTVRS